MPMAAFLKNSMPIQGGLTEMGRILRNHWDAILVTLVLIFVNRTLLEGSVNSALMYHPVPLHAGEWWRLISYPFVHLSWYHLILDAGAFYLLYCGIEENRGSIRLMILVACSAASLLFAVWLGAAETIGLAGLSGIDHGLMAFIALQIMRTAGQRKLGLACFVLVIGKSVYELTTGEAVFLALHADLCGTPIAASHAGGGLAGMIVFWLLNTMKTIQEGDAQC